MILLVWFYFAVFFSCIISQSENIKYYVTIQYLLIRIVCSSAYIITNGALLSDNSYTFMKIMSYQVFCGIYLKIESCKNYIFKFVIFYNK